MTREIRGTEALLLAPLPSVPAPRRIMSKRLADNVPGFLLWLEHALARSPNTVKAYGEDLSMFVAYCTRAGIEYVDQVDVHVIEAFGASLRAHLGQRESSVARRYSALRKFFVYLHRHKLVESNPAALAIPMKLPPRKPPEYMTKKERNRILEALRKRHSIIGRRNVALFATLFLAGLRESEACHLTVADVDLDGRSLYIRDGKGRKDRRVPITPTLVRILRGWITTTRPRCVEADSPWLFVRVRRRRPKSYGRHHGQPLNPKAIWHQVRNHIVPLLGRKVSPHTFRHSYITHIYEESGDLRLAQHLAGHENLKTTAIYAHVTPRKERERLAEYLK